MAKDGVGFRELTERVQEIQRHKKLFLSFSTGADSIATWLRCIESGLWSPTEAILVNRFYLPVSWWLDYLDYFEDRYGVKVLRVQSSLFSESIANWMHQSPARVNALVELRETTGEFQEESREQIMQRCRHLVGLSDDTLTAVGIKQGDSFRRRSWMRKCLGLSETAWYPIHDFEVGDVLDLLRYHGVKVPYDYALFGMSFEQLDYRFAKVIHDRCPANWRMVLEQFPLAETIISRRERYHPDWGLPKSNKMIQLRDRILEPRRPL